MQLLLAQDTIAETELHAVGEGAELAWQMLYN